MPSRDAYDAAHPRCPKRLGSIPSLEHHCLKPMFNDPKSEQWICPRCGPAMTWADAGRRLRRAAGEMWFASEAT